MTNKQMRADFEQAYALTDKTADFQRSANNGHDYYFDDERLAWTFWQAATIAERERAVAVCQARAAVGKKVCNTQYQVGCDGCADAIGSPELSHD